jgi:RND family efflux transporter MFP subunit
MKRNLFLIVVVVAFIALVGYKVIAKTASEADSKQAGQARLHAASVVTVAAAGPKDIASTAQAVGTLESPYQVNLAPNVSGRIDYLEAREGDEVKPGQVLARIDPEYVEGQILQAQGNLAAAQQNLVKTKITQEANTVLINTTIAQNQAAVASAQADYNETIITEEATKQAAHMATVDAEAKVASATSAVATSEANVNLAKANLEDAQAKYARTYNLYSQGFDSPQDLDDQLAAEKVDQATVRAQEKMLDAAKSALHSTKAEYTEAADNEAIAIKKESSDIADAKAKLTQSKQTLASAVANRAQIPAYAENLASLYSQVVAAKATLNQAVAQRAYLIVKSSIEGTVTRRLMDPGAEAVAGSPIVIVQYLRQLFMTAALPVEFSSQIHMGMDMVINLDALPNKTFHGKIVYINKSADPTSRQFMIRSKLDNSDHLLRPGMYAKISIVTSYIHAPIAVPREAVTTDESNNSTVTTVDSNMVAHVTPVTLGSQDANYIEILSGIKAGEKVITLTYRPVADGTKVKLGSWKVKGGKGSTAAGASGHAGTTGAAQSGTTTSGAGGGAAGATGTGTGVASDSPATPGAVGASPPGGTTGNATTGEGTNGAATSGTAASGNAGGSATPSGTGGPGPAGVAGTSGVAATGGAAVGGAAGGSGGAGR